MATAPYGVRLLVGAAVTALEETRRLPQTILMYPMTVASQLAQLVMKMQQDVADLVNKGDETLDNLFPPKDEQPEWATFDEDPTGGDTGAAPDDADVLDLPVRDGERLTEGRFALFSGEPETPRATPARETTSGAASATVPEVVAELDYESLTLAQLRARLTTLRVPDLEALLAYEESTKARAPFQTLLANRITRASAK
ncbi:MAG: lipid droplet-associated protein [Mycobacterium sp.]